MTGVQSWETSSSKIGIECRNSLKELQNTHFLPYRKAYQVLIQFCIIFLTDVKGMKCIIPDIISLDSILLICSHWSHWLFTCTITHSKTCINAALGSLSDKTIYWDVNIMQNHRFAKYLFIYHYCICIVLLWKHTCTV